MNREYETVLEDSKKNKTGICAFNVVNKITAEAVIEAAEEVNMPIIIQVSYSVVKNIGIEATLEFVERAKKDATVSVITNLDHCTDLQFAKECVKAGFQSVMYDGSSLSLEENIRNTKEIVNFAKNYNCHIEGETGLIAGVEDGIGSNYGKLASYEDTVRYIKETEVNVIAPAIGTAHGLYQGSPQINYSLIERLSKEMNCSIAIHGASGLSQAAYRKLIEKGASKINISTALKYAYIDAIKEIVKNEKLPYDPLNFDELLKERVKYEMKKYIEILS